MQAALCSPLTLSAAFVVGMAGSVHCLAMCGGIAGALGMRSRGVPGSSASLHALLYQLGRLTSYSLAGAIVGACGGFLAAMFDVDEIALVARTVAGLVLISVALSVLFGWRPLAHLERLGGHVWSRLAPLARTLPAGGAAGSLLLGMLWGWLPCGFVYSMLIVSRADRQRRAVGCHDALLWVGNGARRFRTQHGERKAAPDHHRSRGQQSGGVALVAVRRSNGSCSVQPCPSLSARGP